MKRKIIILWICMIVLTGCIAKQREPVYRENETQIIHKSNVDSMVGEISAVYKNHIYYFSQENGRSGIYSMNMDGSNVQLEVPSKDIKRLQIVDDILYYLDFEKVFYGSERSSERWGNKFYRLKALNLVSKESMEFTEMENILYNDMYSEVNEEDRYRGIWDYYYMGENEFFVTTLQVSGPTGRFALLAQNIQNGKSVLWEKALFDIFNQYIDVEERKGVLFNKNNIYLLSSFGPTYNENNMNMNAFSIFDSNIDVSLNTRDSILQMARLPVVCRVQGDELFLIIDHEIYKYNVKSNQLVNSLSINDAINIHVYGEYLLADFDDREELYLFDEDQFNVKKLVKLKNGRVVNINLDYYIFLDEKSISKRRIDNNQVVWETKISQNYLSNEHIIEVCSDWLFIKHFDYQAEQGTLAEKIRLSDGKSNLKNSESMSGIPIEDFS